jgi:hypothetical protein
MGMKMVSVPVAPQLPFQLYVGDPPFLPTLVVGDVVEFGGVEGELLYDLEPFGG